MKVAILGDIHGDLEYLDYALGAARLIGVELVIQVGDLGLGFDADFQDQIIEATKHNDMPLWAIRGNHDSPEMFSQHIVLMNFNIIPDGFITTIGNTRVAFVGGAVSIDRTARVPHVSWWPEERVNPSVINQIVMNSSDTADVLISHEAPGVPPNLGNPPVRITDVVQDDCNEDRALIRRAAEELNVHTIYHGHYHKRTTSEQVIGDKKILVEGLASNYQHLNESMIIRDF